MNILTIRGLRATGVNVPLAHPLRTASGTVNEAPLVLIDLVTEEGIVGHAYLFSYTPIMLRPLVQIVESLGSTLKGPLVPPSMEATFARRFRLIGTSGLLAMALSGIDMAAWDALAKAARMPLVRLLGGEPRALPAYSSQGMDGLERGVELAYEALSSGFKAMKIKIGYSTLEEDVAVVRAVKEVLSDRAELFVDYNQSLSVTEAVRRCRILDEFGVSWIEEPTLQDDYVGHAKISLAVRTPVQFGENLFGTAEMAKSLQAGASQLIMIDIMKIGGVTGWLRASALADAARLPLSSHIFPEFSRHALAVSPTAHWLEYLDLAGPVLQEPVQVAQGMVLTSESPGAGLDWDADAIGRYRAA